MSDIMIPSTTPTKGSIILSKLFFALKLALVVVIVGFVASFTSGMISVVNSGIDPIVVLVYLVVAYLSSYYFQLTKTQGYRYFALALIMSFIFPLVEGSIFLLLLVPLLKLLKLIGDQT